jgi:putative colanic acid biosynthesis acetyltransferase WcaF
MTGRSFVTRAAWHCANALLYPWNVQIGDHSWIGERVWLDSLGCIAIGSNVCISQGAYLCTGNHDWTDTAFRLMIKPITVEEGAWIGARAVVLPGIVIATHSVVCAGAIVTGDTRPYTIYTGNPAAAVRRRKVQRRAGRPEHLVQQERADGLPTGKSREGNLFV